MQKYVTEYRALPLTETQAWEIIGWRYPYPYDFYDTPHVTRQDDLVRAFLDPQFRFHGVVDRHGDLSGFCSYGLDGQVPGGDYSLAALDIGLGMKPELTGRGLGSSFLATVLNHARHTLEPAWLRLTVADFNLRALALYRKAGFRDHGAFTDPVQQVAYSILVRPGNAVDAWPDDSASQVPAH